MDTQVNKSLRISQLIEDAAKRAGNESRLAEQLEETRHHVNAWKHGKRVCPVEAQVLMAEIAGHNVAEVLRQAIIEKHEGTPKGEKLTRALGKGLAIAGVAIVSVLYGQDALASKPTGYTPTFHDVYFGFSRDVEGHFDVLQKKFC